jgi:type I restriction enzyme M protein
LFLEARHIYRQIDRAHRDWTEAQVGFLANVVRLYRGEPIDLTLGGDEAGERLKTAFGEQPVYYDVPGLCKVVSGAQLGEKGWVLNPGVYVGVAPGEQVNDAAFAERFEALNEEFVLLSRQAADLSDKIEANAAMILDGALEA